MTIKQINKLKPGRLRALTGLTLNALSQLLTVLLPELVHPRQLAKLNFPFRKPAPGAGAKGKLTPAQELLLVLIYLPHNLAHEVVGALFGVSADTSENLFHEILSLLRESLSLESVRGSEEISARGVEPAN